MSFTIPLPSTSAEAAVGASSAKLTTALDTTQPLGTSMYILCANTNFWWAQGIPDTVFTALASTDVCTATAHGLLQAEAIQVSNSGGALPAGLSAATTYWAIVLDVNTFQLASTRAHALAGTNIDITTNGTGTQTMATVATLAAGSMYTPANVQVLVDGSNGSTIATIEDSGAGKASITECELVR